MLNDVSAIGESMFRTEVMLYTKHTFLDKESSLSVHSFNIPKGINKLSVRHVKPKIDLT